MKALCIKYITHQRLAIREKKNNMTLNQKVHYLSEKVLKQATTRSTMWGGLVKMTENTAHKSLE